MRATRDDIALLYVATFNRAPDSAGLDYWASQDMSLEEIAQSFFDQPETQETYGDATTEDFITQVYQNVLDRDPDSEGLEYWKSELHNHHIDKSEYILAVVNAAQEHPEDAVILQDKHKAALEFVKSGNNDVEEAHRVIKEVEAKHHQDYGQTHGNKFGQESEHGQGNQGEGHKYGQDGDRGHGNGGNGEGHKYCQDGKKGNHSDDSHQGPHCDGGNLNIDDTITLSDDEVSSLLFMYQEEKLAGDVYETLGDRYDLKVFDNIAQAEDRHQSLVGQLLTNAGVDYSNLQALDVGEFENEELQSLYDDLIAKGETSQQDALEVGVLVEETDIKDLQHYLSEDGLNENIVEVYDHLLDGSFHHLDAFNNSLDNMTIA